MPNVVFNITHQQFLNIYEPARSQLLDPAHSNLLAMASDAAVREGDERAYMVPVGDFAIGIGINALRQQALPDELTHRAETAAMVANIAIARAIRERLFVDVYDNNSHLKQLYNYAVTEKLYPALADYNYIKPIADVAFTQTVIMIGGALATLRQNQITSDESHVIDQSRQLELIAHVDTNNVQRVQRRLGIPYARGENFTPPAISDPATIELNRNTRDFIADNITPDSGCPTMHMKPYSSETLFSLRYHEIVGALLSGNVVVSNRPTKVRRRIVEEVFYQLVA